MLFGTAGILKLVKRSQLEGSRFIYCRQDMEQLSEQLLLTFKLKERFAYTSQLVLQAIAQFEILGGICISGVLGVPVQPLGLVLFHFFCQFIFLKFKSCRSSYYGLILVYLQYFTTGLKHKKEHKLI